MLDDGSGFLRLQEGVSRKLEENRERGRKINEHRDEYKKLESKLTSITDNISHDVMVPLTKKAFMPGHLIHTNEIMVLLGENYFLETSALRAREICGRRLQECDKLLEELQQELKLVEGWKNQTSQLHEEGAECREIIEESTEQELEEWRKKHKQSLRREKEQMKSQQPVQDKKPELTDEELWARLEELEVREALEKEWEEDESDDDNDEEDDDDYDDDDNDDDDDDGYAEDEGTNQRLVRMNSEEDVEFLDADRRRVSFGTISQSENLDVPEIRFQHSSAQSLPPTHPSSPSFPAHAGDLARLVLPGQGPTKSILKMPSDYRPEDYVQKEEEHERTHRTVIDEPFHNPVAETIAERPSPADEGAVPPPEPAKKVSKFKAMRAAQR